jgi:hypothetical protein
MKSIAADLLLDRVAGDGFVDEERIPYPAQGFIKVVGLTVKTRPEHGFHG